MEGIREYLFGVIAAAILCAIVTQLSGRDSLVKTPIKLISGVFLILVLVCPIFQSRIPTNITFSGVSQEAEQITAAAADSTRESMAAIIKERVETYILDKAKLQGAQLSVEVTLSEDTIPEPIGVSLSGEISPYSKKLLSQTIENDLGISAEAQIWNG